MNKYSIILTVAILLLGVSVFGGYANYETTGGLSYTTTPDGSIVVTEGTYNIVSGTIGFIGDILTFDVSAGVPIMLSLAFYVMLLLVAFILINWIRGTE